MAGIGLDPPRSVAIYQSSASDRESSQSAEIEGQSSASAGTREAGCKDDFAPLCPPSTESESRLSAAGASSRALQDEISAVLLKTEKDIADKVEQWLELQRRLIKYVPDELAAIVPSAIRQRADEQCFREQATSSSMQAVEREEVPQSYDRGGRHASATSSLQVVLDGVLLASSNEEKGVEEENAEAPLPRVNQSDTLDQLDSAENKARDDAYREASNARKEIMMKTSMDSNIQPSRCRTYLKRIVKSNMFEGFYAAAILSNSLLIGAEIEYQARYLGQTPPTAFAILDYTYTLLFTVELIARVADNGRTFFCGEEWRWAIFDVLIVSFSLAEIVFGILLHDAVGHSESNASNLRAVRMLRMLRLVRAFRIQRLIRFVAALRTLVYSIIVTLKSLVWALALLVMIMYVFGITLTQVAVDSLVAEELSEGHASKLSAYWGSVGLSMTTLFQAITGGISWRESAESIAFVHTLAAWLYYFYIFFTYFAVLNVVTGVFCSCAIEAQQHNPELIVHSLRSTQKANAELLGTLFSAMDSDGSGRITIDEFERVMGDDSTRAILKALELDTSDVWTLFRLIDTDGGGTIDMDEFSKGIEALKGHAKNVDIASMRKEQRDMGRLLLQTTRELTAKLSVIESMLATIKGHFVRA